MIPQDPFILLSYLNTKLRDFYPDLRSLCRDMGLNQEQIEDKMERVGFVYDQTTNQFQ